MDEKLIWFEKIYDSYADAIWRFLYFKLNDQERAEELMQDVFLKLWEYYSSGKEIKNEKALLYKIATNLFINEIRTDKKSVSLDYLEDLGFEPQADIKADNLSLNNELHQVLSTLSNSYKAAITMRYIDGLAVNEIADLLGESETNISMRLKRGLVKLRQAYGLGTGK